MERTTGGLAWRLFKEGISKIKKREEEERRDSRYRVGARKKRLEECWLAWATIKGESPDRSRDLETYLAFKKGEMTELGCLGAKGQDRKQGAHRAIGLGHSSMSVKAAWGHRRAQTCEQKKGTKKGGGVEGKRENSARQTSQRIPTVEEAGRTTRRSGRGGRGQGDAGLGLSEHRHGKKNG